VTQLTHQPLLKLRPGPEYSRAQARHAQARRIGNGVSSFANSRLLAKSASVLCLVCSVLSASVGFAQATLPVIVRQPQPLNTPLGSNALFDVVADAGGAALRYQWRLNGGNISGATGSVLQINSVQSRHAGSYSVAVSTDTGAVASDVVELELSDEPVLPFSDLFGASPFLSGLSGLVLGHNLGATGESGEPLHVGQFPRRSVWAAWTAPASPGIVTFRTVGSGFDTLLAVYAGSLLTQLAPVRGDDDGGGFLTSQVSFRTQPGVSYRIAVDGFGGAAGRFVLSWSFEGTQEGLPVFSAEPLEQAFAPGSDAVFTVTTATNYLWQWFFDGQPLTNENAATLRVRNVGFNNVGLYFCRGFEPNAPSRFRDSRTVRLQLNSDGFGVANAGSLSTEKLFDVRVLANDFAGLGKDDSIFDVQSLTSPRSSVSSALDWAATWSPGGRGTVTESPGRSVTKSQAKSVAHGFSGTQIFTTLGSTKELDEPFHCGVVGGASEWFAFQADANGTIVLDTEGSNFDTVLAVYSGPGDSFASLVSVACDNNSGTDGKDSRVSFAGTAGTIYWIAVDGVNHPGTGQPAKGTVMLHYRLLLPLSLSAVAYGSAAGGTISFRVSGTPNVAATVQASTDFNPTNWLSLVTNATPSGVFNFTNVGTSAFSNRYFRAVNRF